jgi:hypothetical protein
MSLFRWRTAALLTMLLAAFAVPASAQDTLGGHIGVVFPLVTHTPGDTTNLADNFSIGVPVGITVRGTGKLAFDLELIPGVQDTPRKVTFTVHPGILYDLGHRFTAGLRIAFDVGTSQWGYTPLINKSWPIRGANFFKAYFVEADVPVRFNRPTGEPGTNAVTFAMHFGLGF